MRHRTRNPSFPLGLALGAAAGVGVFIWWATRQTAAATAQQLVASGAQAFSAPIGQGIATYTPALAYTGDVQGRALTAAEAEAMGLASELGANLSRADIRSASLTAAMQQANDPTLSAQTREVAARLVAQLQGTIA